ncbi:MAG: preprotein translocase subunit SecA [Myxococcota bacterium]
MSFLSKIFGTKNERELKRLQPRVAAINALEDKFKALPDAELALYTQKLKERVANALQATGKPQNELTRADYDAALDPVLHEAFALTREAGRRVMGMRHFDVQLIGGMVLHEGKIAEMKTGEGKTLVSTLPGFLNALSGRGVHVVTVNDYLATRDAEWMGRIYRYLGMTVGVIIHGLNDRQRQQAYGSDVTYGQNNEFGFDYLRDNMKFALKDYTQQRGHHFAVVDEVDSILIDEARTPLIISGQAEQSTDLYRTVNAIIPKLKKDEHYTIDEKAKTATLTEEGVLRAEKLLSVDNLYDPANIELLHHTHQALRAHTLYKRDVEYVVDGGEVKIVDEHTGRIMEGRRWSDGLHQAIEAKEGVQIENETVTLATVTFQNFFRMYGKLSGMTGTADTEAEEFAKIYNLDVVVIPTNRKVSRVDNEDVVYKTEREKFDAVTTDLEDCYSRGQPVLVGTTSVEKSEVVARLLKKKNIPHEVLNAKQHRREAEIIAQAGRKGKITISTNMAGRGTDILLGGNAEYMARAEVAKYFAEEEARIAAESGIPQGLGIHEVARFTFLSGKPDLINVERLAAEESGLPYDVINKLRLQDAATVFADAKLPPEMLERYEKDLAFFKKAVSKYAEVLPGFADQCAREKDEVIKVGGLHILGTERHESRRIDNQLRGRAGRQGDPGSSRFFLSLQDDLMRIFGGDKLIPMMEKLGMQEGEPIEARMVSKSVENAQKKVEGHHFDMRKNLLEYDDVMNMQRKATYALRRQVLEGKGVHEMILDRIEDVIIGIVDEACPPDVPPPEWKSEEIKTRVKDVFGVSVDLVGATNTREDIQDKVYAECERFYVGREKEFGEALVRHLEQFLFLQTIDQHWKEHLLAMDHLREGIYLRGYGQKDPKQEYKKEGYNLFVSMMNSIGTDIVQKMFKVQIRREEEVEELERRRAQQAARQRIQTTHVAAPTSASSSDEAPAPAAAARGAPAAQPAAAPSGNGGGAPQPQAAGPAQPQVPLRRQVPKIGRNDVCYCGSGKKYKKCHLPEDEALGLAPPA